MCTQGCRTWLWGGEGSPTYDEQGRCSCVCEDERWSDHNLLGRASCVPEVAHLIFGWAGLALSLVALCHAAYQLNRQLEYHARELLAPTLPVEKCRKRLHLSAVTVDAMCLCLFSMVLGDEIRWSGVLVSAIHIPSNISGVFGTRVWMYTTGHGLMNRSPEMLKLSAWLETRAGHSLTCTAVSIVPCVATILAVAGHQETAFKMTAAGLMAMSIFVSGLFWICGKSLIRVIDHSLDEKTKARVYAKNGKLEDLEDVEDHEDFGDQTLLATREKVNWMLGFVSRQLVLMGFILMLAIFSKYGTAAPLLLFGIPLVFMSILKLIIVVQLFAGRSKLSTLQGLRYGTGRHPRISRAPKSLTYLINSRYSKGQVVPIENPSTLNNAPPDESQQFGIPLE